MNYLVNLQHITGQGILTSDHVASSGGRPVLVINGEAHGPTDPVGAQNLPPYIIDVMDGDGEPEAAEEAVDDWNHAVKMARD